METYVFIPLKQWKVEQEEIKKKKCLGETSSKSNQDLIAGKEEKTISPAKKSVVKKTKKVAAEKEKSPFFPIKRSEGKKGKNLTSDIRANQVKKLLEELQSKGPTPLNRFSNLAELVADSLSQSRKEKPNEKEFYNFMFQNNLAHMIKNKAKAERYYKYSWFNLAH